jgi:hypothetical protein
VYAIRPSPQPIGQFKDVTVPGDVDPTTLASTDVIAYFTVDPSGHAHFQRVSPSTGNDELDNEIRRIVEEQIFKPATDHDGNPISFPCSHEFAIG